MGRKKKIADGAKSVESFVPVDSLGNRLSFEDTLAAVNSGKNITVISAGWSIGDKQLPPLEDNSCVAMNLALVAIIGACPTNCWAEKIEPILLKYHHARFVELNAPNEASVWKKIVQIEAAANKLKRFMDIEKASPLVGEMALRRITQARHPFDKGEDLRDAVYPGLCLLVARIHALNKKDSLPQQPASLQILIADLADLTRTLGGTVSASNSQADSSGTVTPFVNLVWQALKSSPLQPPLRLTETALTQAIIVALRNGENKKPT